MLDAEADEITQAHKYERTVISSKPYHQEIVKVEMVKEEPETAKTVCGPMQIPGQRKGICAERNAVMELVVGNVRIKVTNQIDTKLLAYQPQPKAKNIKQK
jgi:hypothetical protein